MKIFVNKKTSIGFVAALATMLVTGSVLLQIPLRQSEANRWVEYTHLVLTELETTLSIIKDAETGQRGYLLTGDESYLESYNAAISKIDGQIQHLRKLTADNPNQQRRIAFLEHQITEKLSELKETITLRQKKGFEMAWQVVITNRGKQNMDDIRQVITKMQKEENQLLERRTKESFAIVQTTILTFLMLMSLNLALIGLIYYLVNRDLGDRKQADEELRQSEERFRATFNQAAVGIAHVAFDGKWLLVNQKLCQIVGYTQQELLERTFQDITHPDDLNSDLEFVRQMLAKEIQTYSMEKRYIRKDGSPIWINLTVSLVREPSGKPKYFITVIEDIGDRKRTGEEVFLLQTITQAIGESKDFPSALEVALRKLCEATNWDYGEAWIPRPDGCVLKCSSAWYGSGSSLDTFRRLSKELEFSLGTGLPGRVWLSKQSEWIQDVSREQDTAFLRVKIAAECGLKAALATPILANNQVLAVLVFFMSENCEEDKRLVDLISVVATQLGSVFQRKRAELELRSALQKLSFHVENTPLAVIEWNHEFRLQRWSKQAEKVFGWQADEVVGKYWQEWQFVFEEDLEAVKTHGASLADGSKPSNVSHNRNYTKDGKVIDCEWYNSALLDESGNLVSILSLALDVSDRKRAEKQIRELNQDLERRVLERTAQLEAANKELEAFCYSVSHDLRTPLRSIDGFSLALLERYSLQLDDKGKHYLQRVRTATQRMGQLIEDLLNLSRVTRSSMQRTEVDLTATAMAIALELQHSQPERTVEFDIAPAVVAQGDPRLLRVVLENLLGNAWKFTSKQVLTQIEFGTLPQKDGIIAYFVRDNGAGFDMAYADKLFGAFQRLHTEQEFPGTGIGLATVARIVHRHGGRVWAESVLKVGAIFYFTL